MQEIVLLEGDLTTQDVDAIVNAANSSLLGGGGVDGAIHRAGGPSILAECRGAPADRVPRRAADGAGRGDGGGDLPARWVIHTVGPVYRTSDDPAGELASCHTESLRVADELGARTVAFPAISTGAFGYPLEEAAAVAVAGRAGCRHPGRGGPVRALRAGGVRRVRAGARGAERTFFRSFRTPLLGFAST